eukprot:748313-Hanusia_phi.AAC.1
MLQSAASGCFLLPPSLLLVVLLLLLLVYPSIPFLRSDDTSLFLPPPVSVPVSLRSISPLLRLYGSHLSICSAGGKPFWSAHLNSDETLMSAGCGKLLRVYDMRVRKSLARWKTCFDVFLQTQKLFRNYSDVHTDDVTQVDESILASQHIFLSFTLISQLHICLHRMSKWSSALITQCRNYGIISNIDLRLLPRASYRFAATRPCRRSQ